MKTIVGATTSRTDLAAYRYSAADPDPPAFGEVEDGRAGSSSSARLAC
jgi:hypothetical protein